MTNANNPKPLEAADANNAKAYVSSINSRALAGPGEAVRRARRLRRVLVHVLAVEQEGI
jgi:hypothetical protein